MHGETLKLDTGLFSDICVMTLSVHRTAHSRAARDSGEYFFFVLHQLKACLPHKPHFLRLTQHRSIENRANTPVLVRRNKCILCGS